MKKIIKILVIVLTIILLATALQIVSNAATITINNNTPTSNSSSFDVYEILKKTGTGYELTDNAKNYFTTNVTITINNTTKYLTTVDEVLEYLTDLANGNEDVNYSISTKEAFATDYISKVTADKSSASNTITDVEYGYYLVYDVNGDPKSQNMLFEVNEDTTIINVKAIGITLEKQATNGDSHYVGETIDYTIKTVVPDMADYTSYKFIITDKPQNLEINTNSVKVSIGGTDITESVQNKITTSSNQLTVDLGDYLFTNKSTLTVGNEILVTYEATLTVDAIKTSTATNDATLTYSNDPYTDSEGTVTIPQGSEKIYTYSVTFNKKSSIGKDLEGATFVVKTSEEKYINVDSKTKAITLVNSQDDATVYTGGTFTVEGLKEGTYELVETKAPTDYKVSTGLIFKISNDDSSTIGTLDPATVTHSLSLTDDSSNLEIVTGSGLDGFNVNVINSKTLSSILLPSTGGIGTTIFTVVGIVLMATAVIALIVINRKKNK